MFQKLRELRECFTSYYIGFYVFILYIYFVFFATNSIIDPLSAQPHHVINKIKHKEYNIEVEAQIESRYVINTFSSSTEGLGSTLATYNLGVLTATIFEFTLVHAPIKIAHKLDSRAVEMFFGLEVSEDIQLDQFKISPYSVHFNKLAPSIRKGNISVTHLNSKHLINLDELLPELIISPSSTNSDLTHMSMKPYDIIQHLSHIEHDQLSQIQQTYIQEFTFETDETESSSSSPLENPTHIQKEQEEEEAASSRMSNKELDQHQNVILPDWLKDDSEQAKLVTLYVQRDLHVNTKTGLSFRWTRPWFVERYQFAQTRDNW